MHHAYKNIYVQPGQVTASGCALLQQTLTECSVGVTLLERGHEAAVLQGCQATQEHHPAGEQQQQ
jgi:hypothetical protein